MRSSNEERPKVKERGADNTEDNPSISSPHRSDTGSSITENSGTPDSISLCSSSAASPEAPRARQKIPIRIVHESKKPKSKHNVISIPVHHVTVDQSQNKGVIKLRRREKIDSPPGSPKSLLDVDALQNQRKSLERDMRVFGESFDVLPDEEISCIRNRMEKRAANLMGALESYKKGKEPKQKRSMLGVKSKIRISLR